MGAIVSLILQRFTITVLAALSFAVAAQAEDFVMPYVCKLERGEPRLMASNDTTYRLLSRREEQPFSACPASRGGACETMMVHRFAIACDGQRVTWASVAAATKSMAKPLPENLPPGFAPVSTLAGRFILPALIRTEPQLTQVAMQDLSPDSVVERGDSDAEPQNATWVTTVRADMRPESQGGATRVAGAVMSLLAVLFAISMFAAKRWRLPALTWADLPGIAHNLKSHILERTAAVTAAVRRRARVEYQAWVRSAERCADNSIMSGFAIVHARIAETDLLVATLPGDLLLRDVLQAEIENVRFRAAEANKRLYRMQPEKAAGLIRILVRELDRISRIAHGVAQGPQRQARDEAELPRTVGEAYQVLGINAEAAPQVAKKLVDALRMSWHPDFARDEDDRQRREDRMKQINAAWDMIKDRREAA